MSETSWIPMTVIEVHQETEFLLSIQAQPRLEGTQFEFRAGQYVKVQRPAGRESYFAIASEPEERNYIEFLVKDVHENSSNDLCQVRPDDEVRVSLPMGKGYPRERLLGNDVLLIGMGTGLSPLRSVLKSILRDEQSFGKVTLVYGVRRPEDIPFVDDFNLWSKKIRLETCVSQRGKAYWRGFEGRVTQFLPKISFSPDKTVACVCGNKEMQEEVKKILIGRGLNQERILFNF